MTGIRRYILLLSLLVFAFLCVGCKDTSALKISTGSTSRTPSEIVEMTIDAAESAGDTMYSCRIVSCSLESSTRCVIWFEEIKSMDSEEAEEDLEEDAAENQEDTLSNLLLTSKTTIVYATNSNPRGSSMTPKEFSESFVANDDVLFIAYVNKSGTVDLLFSLNVLENAPVTKTSTQETTPALGAQALAAVSLASQEI